MRYFVTVAGRTLEVDLSGATPRVDGRPMHAELARLPGTQQRHLLVDGRSVPLRARRAAEPGRWQLALGGERLAAEVEDERTRALREMTGGQAAAIPRTVAAPMPGLVVRVEVEEGQEVAAGQGVLVVEAMKMENELRAPAAGRVARVHVQPGQAVEKGATLITLE